jgi:tRNA (mo5U34)-methyltransferase
MKDRTQISLFERYTRSSAAFAEIAQFNRSRNWARELEHHCEYAFDPDKNGNLPRWMEAYKNLPVVEPERVELNCSAVTCSATLDSGAAQSVEKALRALAPWRKGPFQIFDTFVDAEWRSNQKWERLTPHLDLENKLVLDVGCGNGYYGWRMLGRGARCVIGLDPSLLYVMQHATIRRCLGEGLPNFVLPAPDTILPENLRIFDTVFSMGVLYHRKSPIEHLQALAHALKPKGEVILETLIIEGGDREVLIPSDRYAMMKNVWFLPSCGLLCKMMEKCGFEEVRTLDVTPTTVEEQRSTEWMTFDSLPQFLNPEDPRFTVEGYPAPLRAVVKGVRG